MTPSSLPLADLAGAKIYSSGWTVDDSRVFTIWYELPSGAVALASFTLGKDVGQDMQPRIVCDADQ